MDTILQAFWNSLSEERKKEIKDLYSYVKEEKDSIEKDNLLNIMHDLFKKDNLESKELKITFYDIANELFKEKIEDTYETPVFSDAHAEKLSSINALICVTKYLNGDWKPNWSNEDEKKWFISTIGQSDKIDYYYDLRTRSSFVYFRTKELACKAVEILGKEIIIKALSSDY